MQLPANKRPYLSKIGMLILGLLTSLLVACGSDGVSAVSTPQTTATHATATSGTVSATPIPSATTSSPPAPATTALTSIRMLNQTTGWALTAKSVLKTNDGGLHWKELMQLPAVTLPASAAFMDSKRAWITLRESGVPQGVFNVIRTSDGGASWQTVTIKDTALAGVDAGIDRPHFVSAQEGWVTIGGAEGMHHSAMDIFHTTDGGQSWHLLVSTSASTTNGLSDIGNKTGISFKDSQTGWVGAEIPAVYSLLYKTSDGGKTWHNQPLPIPREIGGKENIGGFQTTPPVFFGNDGLLPVLIADQAQLGLDLYVTHDGGNTWTPTMFTNFNGSNVYVADMQHAWATDKTAVYATRDGGQHWTKLTDTIQPLGELSFVDMNTGWAIGTAGNDTPLLVHTLDAGKTWQEIGFIILSQTPS